MLLCMDDKRSRTACATLRLPAQTSASSWFPEQPHFVIWLRGGCQPSTSEETMSECKNDQETMVSPLAFILDDMWLAHLLWCECSWSIKSLNFSLFSVLTLRWTSWWDFVLGGRKLLYSGLLEDEFTVSNCLTNNSPLSRIFEPDKWGNHLLAIQILEFEGETTNKLSWCRLPISS